MNPEILIVIAALVGIICIVQYFNNLHKSKLEQLRLKKEAKYKEEQMKKRLREEFINNSIKSRSINIKNLIELNNRYVFESTKNEYIYNVDLNTLQKFKSFDKVRYIKNLINESDIFDNAITKINKNKEIWNKYLKDYNNIHIEDEYDFDKLILNYGDEEIELTPISYKHRELHIINELRKNKPVTEFVIKINYYYTSPGGRSRYSNVQCIYFDEFEKIYEKIKKKNSFAYEQRKLMTNSLRYDVLKRDGFKCTLCGRTASDDITLEVDHIIPVSKGGLTELDNLRTLCYDCNRGKRDKIE